MDICSVCKSEIDDNDCGECCNFCNADICEKCFDKVIYDRLMYGWVCEECESTPNHCGENKTDQ